MRRAKLSRWLLENYTKRVKSETKAAAMHPDLFELNPDGFVMYPRFRDEHEITSPQIHILGFYCLIENIVSTLQSINFLIGANHSYFHDLYAPSTVLSYTAAFHAARSFSGQNGRITFQSNREEVTRAAPRLVLCKITRNCSWILERRTPEHTPVWRDFIETLKAREGFPDSIIYWFHQNYDHRSKPGFDLVERIRKEPHTRYQLSEVLSDLIFLIPTIRHRAVYEAMGEDPYGLDAIYNDEVTNFTKDLLARQAKDLLVFASKLTLETLDNLLRFLETLPLEIELRRKIATRLIYRCDKPRLEKIGDVEIKTKLRRLEELVTPWSDELATDAKSRRFNRETHSN